MASLTIGGFVVNFTKTESKTQANTAKITELSDNQGKIQTSLEQNKLNDELRHQKLEAIEESQKSLKQLYTKFSEMEKDLLTMKGENNKDFGIILEKLDTIINQNKQQHTNQRELENRVAQLEKKIA